jgi:tetratricopeptide (TPR) repeat protein
LIDTGRSEEVRPGPDLLLPAPGKGRGRRIVAVAVLAFLLFGVGGLGLWTGHGSSTGPVAARLPGDRGPSVPGHAVILAGSLREEIAGLQARLEALPQDWRSWAMLGLAYVQEARVTADPRFYPRAQGALSRSLSIHRHGNFEASTGEGALALARHDFAGALTWGRRARAINPYNGNIYGVIGDALVELGRYRQAFATFQHMVDLRPDLSSYARASYALELQGDVQAAIRAMKLALGAAGTPEDQAFAAFYLGELYFNSGRADRAATYYRRGAQLAPDYIPPQAGLAKVAWARGNLTGAIHRYERVVSRYPLPEYVIALGDLYTRAGDPRRAAREYALVHVEERLFQAAGVNVDLELSLFEADHGDPAAALRAARDEWGRRHSILVADALGWSLHRSGRDREALPYAKFAQKLGYGGALIHFHAGMIHLALGHRAAGRAQLRRALEINPHFSILYAPVALRYLGAAR